MKVKPSHKFYRLLSIGLIVIIAFLLLSIQNFAEVKGQEFSNSSSYSSEINILTSQITLISEELLKEQLSPQMRKSLTEKLELLQNYSDMMAKRERTLAIKDKNLQAIAPEVNDPPFQQGIFPGGDHLLRDYAVSANNYFQTEYLGNYIQIVAGKNLATLSGSLYMITTSSDKIDSEMFSIPLPEHIHDLIIVSFEGNYITLSDQDKQIYRFELETKIFVTKN